MLTGPGLTLLASLLLAQAAIRETPSTVPEVTVTAPGSLSPAEQVRRLGQTDGKGRLARWAEPVCPTTVGLPPAFDDFISGHVKAVATDVGAEAGAKGCKTNVLILITPKAEAFTRQVVALKARQLASGRWGMDRSNLQAFAAGDRPVHWFYVADTAQDIGGSVNTVNAATISAASVGSGLDKFLNNSASPGAPSYSDVVPSRLKPSGDEAFSEIVIVVDASRIAGLSAGQVGDYLSMVALSHVRAEESFSEIDTILNLFVNTSKPAGLTAWDMAYLSGLYRVDGQATYASQISHIAAWMQTHRDGSTTTPPR